MSAARLRRSGTNPNALRFMRENPDWSGKLITKGGWDHAIVDELTPGPGDIVVHKIAL